ncbi:hypothetical protein [Pseudomonas sp. D(2018)]|uniref:hypothetical protein n=1 Tax=Pseudomonas sp. D(2018) TaxID=2502238 RepID=UPI0010F7D24C|nr:hypothetical protein [Pseudomonas sp. D(2018)]
MNTKTWWMATLLALSIQAGASDLFKPEELSDAELSQLRGRYVLPDRIISFGVVMTSTWENAAGQVIGAQVGMSLSSGQVQPALYSTPIQRAGNGSSITPGSGQVIGGSGLDSVRGVVQSVRAAGDGNNGENGLDIRISQGGEAQSAPATQSWGAEQTVSNAAGMVRISSGDGGLGIAIQASNGQGTSSQRIGAGGVAQQSAIGGDLNHVRNLASLEVHLRDVPRVGNLRQSFDQLRGLCPTR